MELVWNKYGISMEYRGIIIFEQNFDGVFGFFDNVYFFLRILISNHRKRMSRHRKINVHMLTSKG